MYISALFHNIGKYICTKVENSEIVSPNHSIIGAKIFRELVYRKYAKIYNIDFYIREKICNLIRYHGLPLFFIEKDNIDYELIKTSEYLNMNLLYILAKANKIIKTGIF